MSALYDRATLRSLKQAWRNKLKSSGITSSPASGLSNLLGGKLFLLALGFFTYLIGKQLCFDYSHSIEEKTSNLILVMSALGLASGAIVHGLIFVTRDKAILTQTPITKGLALRHNFNGLLRFLVFPIFIVAVFGVLAAIEIGANDAGVVSYIVAVAFIFILSNCLGVWVSFYYSGLLSLALPAFFILYLYIEKIWLLVSNWRGELAPQLLAAWPPACVLQWVRSSIPIPSMLAAVGIVLYTGWKIKKTLATWQVDRPDWDEMDDYQEWLEEEYGGKEKISHNDNFAENPSPSGWIEKSILAVMNPRQKVLLGCLDMPLYSFRWRISLGLLVVGFFAWYFLPTSPPVASWLRGGGVALVALSCCLVFPFGTSFSGFLNRESISYQVTCPVFLMMPVSHGELWHGGLREYVLRCLFCIPQLAALSWVCVAHGNYSEPDIGLFAARFFLAFIWMAGLWFAIKYVFSIPRSRKNGRFIQRVFYYVRCLIIAICGFLIIICVSMGIPSLAILTQDLDPLLLLNIPVSIVSALVICVMTYFEQRSPRSDMTMEE